MNDHYAGQSQLQALAIYQEPAERSGSHKSISSEILYVQTLF